MLGLIVIRPGSVPTESLLLCIFEDAAGPRCSQHTHHFYSCILSTSSRVKGSSSRYFLYCYSISLGQHSSFSLSESHLWSFQLLLPKSKLGSSKYMVQNKPISQFSNNSISMKWIQSNLFLYGQGLSSHHSTQCCGYVRTCFSPMRYAELHLMWTLSFSPHLASPVH